MGLRITNEPELKPCPFCGGEAYYTHIKMGKWKCSCFDCGATVKELARESTPEGRKKDRAAVIKKWNRRVETSHGHWMDREEIFASELQDFLALRDDEGTPESAVWCNLCGGRSETRTNYCPNCGATMQWEEKK